MAVVLIGLLAGLALARWGPTDPPARPSTPPPCGILNNLYGPCPTTAPMPAPASTAPPPLCAVTGNIPGCIPPALPTPGHQVYG